MLPPTRVTPVTSRDGAFLREEQPFARLLSPRWLWPPTAVSVARLAGPATAAPKSRDSGIAYTVNPPHVKATLSLEQVSPSLTPEQCLVASRGRDPGGGDPTRVPKPSSQVAVRVCIAAREGSPALRTATSSTPQRQTRSPFAVAITPTAEHADVRGSDVENDPDVRKGDRGQVGMSPTCLAPSSPPR